jgi:hypothetical protein
MSVFSIPHKAREIRATEARIEAVYRMARLGLKGDALALASDMHPDEYRALREFDPLMALAEAKGRADSEAEVSAALHACAVAGDSKAAIDILKHQHGWVSKQQISVDIEERISITHALQLAQTRVIEGLAIQHVSCETGEGNE